LLLLHAALNTQIGSLNRQIENLTEEVKQDRDTEMQVASIIERTKMFEKIKDERGEAGDKLGFLLKESPTSLEFKKLALSDKEATINITTEDALSFVLLTKNYFENANVVEITLETAQLNMSKGTFDMQLKVRFK
jgi:hypothetical protein